MKNPIKLLAVASLLAAAGLLGGCTSAYNGYERTEVIYVPVPAPAPEPLPPIIIDPAPAPAPAPQPRTKPLQKVGSDETNDTRTKSDTAQSTTTRQPVTGRGGKSTRSTARR